MKDLFVQGYKLYVDNWYTSEKLFKYLEEDGTAGSARANRLKLPNSFKRLNYKKGNICFDEMKIFSLFAITTRKRFLF